MVQNYWCVSGDFKSGYVVRWKWQESVYIYIYLGDRVSAGGGSVAAVIAMRLAFNMDWYKVTMNPSTLGCEYYFVV